MQPIYRVIFRKTIRHHYHNTLKDRYMPISKNKIAEYCLDKKATCFDKTIIIVDKSYNFK